MSQTFEVFYDGDCSLCVREIGALRALDRRARVGAFDRMLERAYAAFAARRLRLTGRCDARGCAVPRRRVVDEVRA